MPDPIISHQRRDTFVQELVERMRVLALQLCEQLTTASPSLQHLEDLTLHTIKTLGTTLLTGLCGLCTPPYPPPHVTCACGGHATYLRRRPAHVSTLLGRVTIQRP